ncbi:hypothetical protein [Rhodovarius lipocyclicus]|uniref:hypothetical protein n=1 Tax=Rhodovarius lipocyclicus TaxID=268410 RepID=UPI001358106A|nr:hypothetical protein [Rhodovarius lipocyclicus]
MSGLDAYDAGLLNDWGGGNVERWQDYIRAELGRAHDFYVAQHAAEVEQARREGAPFADLTDDERIVGVIRSTNRNGQDVRVMVKQWDCFDGAPPHITIAVHVGEGRWVEAEMKPEDALKVVHLALLKPAIRARGGSDAG